LTWSVVGASVPEMAGGGTVGRKKVMVANETTVRNIPSEPQSENQQLH